VNAVKFGVNTSSAAQVAQISVALRIKGAQGVQEIPVRLKTGWSSAQETIDWAKVGALSEIVFVVTPQGDAELAKGALYLTLEFLKTAVAVKPAAAAPAVAVAQVKQVAAAVKAAVPAQPAVVDMTNNLAEIPVQDTRKYGTNNLGGAKGSVATTFDDVSGKDVLDFGYTLPKGSSIQVWTKNFPEGLNAAQANTIKIGLRVPEPGQAAQISMQAELKGTKGVQNVPVQLKSGWNALVGGVDCRRSAV
jgi:hypothetical protein